MTPRGATTGLVENELWCELAHRSTQSLIRRPRHLDDQGQRLVGIVGERLTEGIEIQLADLG